MIVSSVVNKLSDKVLEIINALSNRLTARDNWGPEGEKGQVLTSNGPRDTDPPPSFQSFTDILKGISPTTLQGIPGLQGPQGPAGPQGPGTPILRGGKWGNGGTVVDLLGETIVETPVMQVGGNITQVYILGRGNGSATFGVKKTSTYPAGLVDITGGSDAVIVASSFAVMSLAGWDTAVSIGDVLEFEMKAVSVFTQVEIVLEITPT